MNKLFTLLLAIICMATVSFAAERNTPYTPEAYSSITSAESIDAGTIVGTTGGYGYTYISTSTNLVVLGIAQNSAVSNGTLIVRSGIFGLKNLGNITTANVGSSAYASTNNNGYTVSASGSAAVGKIIRVDSDYVWIRAGL